MCHVITFLTGTCSIVSNNSIICKSFYHRITENDKNFDSDGHLAQINPNKAFITL